MNEKRNRISENLTVEYSMKMVGEEYALRCIAMDENGNEADRAEVQGITPDKKRAEEILETVSLHGVTPCTLKDVIEDLLS